ncbi:hypothetical protein [Treponema sp.]|uniref:hypothetical protein n=1 Tax=Treponema sp. TaxID=166 RepID=UPI00257EC98F|nr:hypothetical protein [Treponema sp.]MBE6355339.1 hypothetical protein [Treponema sp.]
MNKIFKILSILMMVFVLFSCADPSSNPEDPTVTEPQGYSITFVAKEPVQQPVADLLNSSPDYKNLKEGTEVELPTVIYMTEETEQLSLELTESSTHENGICYEGNITSVVVGNEDIEIKCWLGGGFTVVKR